MQYSILTIQSIYNTVYLQYSLRVDLKQFDARCCDNNNTDSLLTKQSTYNTDSLLAIQTVYLQYSLLATQTVYLQHSLLTIQSTYNTDSLRVDLKRFDARCCDNNNADNLFTIQTVCLQYRQSTHSTASLCADLKRFDSRCCDNSNADSFILTIIIDSLRVVK